VNANILKVEEFLPIREKIGKDGGSLVFTNGCFDIIHRGHVEYLAKARSYGDFLLVALNTDQSVREIKGPTRPIIPEEDRAVVLAAIESVDFVILFDESTPEKLIEAVRPDVLAKGADWPMDKIIGADIVKANGGKVVRIELTPHRGTSEIINRIDELRGRVDGSS